MSRPTPTRSAWIARYRAARQLTEGLAAPLSPEDQQLQSMPACSPTKWHRAHTTWFFETFALDALGHPTGDQERRYLWNSYYEAVGARHPRSARGLLSRPSADEVAAYRREVDDALTEALAACDDATFARAAPLIALGVAHEEQHQELILTDILHAFSHNPLEPAYRPVRAGADAVEPGAALAFTPYDGGLVEIGAAGAAEGFAFDHEGPRHRVWLEPFAMATRCVTVGEVRAFIDEGGYRTPSLWLSDGWAWVSEARVEAPLYARYADGCYRVFGLHGARTAHDDEPAAHLSFYEADAIARFLGARLPTEAEWEHAARAGDPAGGQHLDPEGPLYPRPPRPEVGCFGGVWQWTRSAYAPYPGFAPGPGAIGEYNGKFMANQVVLRGGSCLTPRGHVRATYRNFWYPQTRFQMTGARLARDLDPRSPRPYA